MPVGMSGPPPLERGGKDPTPLHPSLPLPRRYTSPMPQAANLLANALEAIGYAFLPALLLPFITLLTPRIHPFARTLCDLIDTFSHAIGSLVRWLYPLLVM